MRAVIAFSLLLTAAPGSSTPERLADSESLDKICCDRQLEIVVQADGTNVVVTQRSGQSEIEVEKKKKEQEAPKFWVGVNCLQVGDTLRSHLNLKKKVGLIVIDVSPDSPAATAGLKRHDVLVKLGKSELATCKSLGDAVQANANQPVALELFRGGKKQTVRITPAKRPDKMSKEVYARLKPAQFRIHSELPLKSSKQNPRFRFVGPGVVVSGGRAPNAGKDYQIRVFKSKEGVRTVVVKTDAGTYEATADSLHEVPYEVRTLVATVLNAANRSDRDFTVNGESLNNQSGGVWVQKWTGGPWGGWGPAGIQLIPTGYWIRPGSQGGAGGTTAQADKKSLEQKLEEMNRKLDSLTKAFERLQSGGK